MRKLISAIFIATILFSLSCQKTANLGQTNAAKAARGWWVTFTLGGSDVYQLGTVFIDTYNTSAQDDSLWVDDLGHTWNFKCKAKVDYSTLAFSTENAQNQYYDIKVKLANGKILSKAGKSRSGNATDSLYVEATFSDDPTNTYVISGTARTGFIEDDY